MKSFGILAASALFGALVNAAPVNKRDVVWITETAVDVVTVPITMTVWVDGGATSTDSSTTTATVQAAQYHPSRTHSPVFSTTTDSATVAPVETSTSTSDVVAPSTSSTSAYVAPTTTSSTSIYVAPTTTSSTSIYVAPTTTSSTAVVEPTTTEAPTSTYVAPTTTSSTAAAATTSASSGSGSGAAAAGTSYTGDLTWYAVGEGACGFDNVPTDHIVAVSEIIFDDPLYYTANPNNNPLCKKSVTITGSDGTQYVAKVVDRCTGCAKSDLDLSEDFFNTVTNNGDGRVPDMTWVWN
ncbi:hypothetical protein MBLNU459_g6214t1 [Dothideomycetes sp. NU459]